MGAAAVTFVRGRKVFAANAEMKISFLAPVPAGAVLTCTAEVVSGGNTVAFVEASVWAGAGAGAGAGEPAGRLVARANSTYILRSRDPD
jgi:acyl-coenzyme A thioesterase PaaI-like protein